MAAVHIEVYYHFSQSVSNDVVDNRMKLQMSEGTIKENCNVEDDVEACSSASDECEENVETENSSNSESDEDYSTDEKSSSTSTSISSSSSSEASELDGASDEHDLWSLDEENTETEEAQEVGLNDEFSKALQLIANGRKESALRLMSNLLEHSLLAKYSIDPYNFDWEDARKEAKENGASISGMARLYASLHYHIAMLNVDPILHYLCALTIYVNNDQLWARVGECAMQRSDWPTALFALENSSGWNALNGIIISMYKQRLYLECLRKLASILPFDQHYATGLAIKRAIRKSNAYWENKCREIFNEDAAYDVDDSVETVEMYDKIIERLNADCGMKMKEEVESGRIIQITLNQCMTVVSIGNLLCSAFDNIENYGSFALDKINLKSNEATTNDYFDLVVRNIVDDIVDCVCVLESTLIQIHQQSLLSHRNSDDGSMKGEDLNYSFEWNRRSTRFRTEFIIDDTNGWQEDTSRIDTLLKEACVLERSIRPLRTIKGCMNHENKSDTKKFLLCDAMQVDEEFIVKRYLNSISTIKTNESIFSAIKRFLFIIATVPYRWTVSDRIRNVLIECYLRWLKCDSHDCEGLVTRSEAYLHLLGAELGCHEGVVKCLHITTNNRLNNELMIRLNWMFAVHYQNCNNTSLCYVHLKELYDLLSSESESNKVYVCLINQHQTIDLHHTHSLIQLAKHQETLAMIAHYFSLQQFSDVINLFETSFNWSEVGDGDIECNVLTLIDAYIAVKNYNSAAVWLCRAIDYLSSFSSVDEALKRIHLLVDLRSVERETISNLVHSVVPLLMSEPHKTDLSLWIFVYESARLLEGERSVESLRALYASGSLMLNSSLNVLVIAHDMLAESECCYAENYRFLIFELRELANVRAERNVDEALSDGQHTEQLRAYYDELHQCLFCMFGCPSRLKRLLEEHGGSHSYEPSEEDAMFIASLLLPDPLPSYNDTLCSDLIEIVQKKLTQFIQPIDHETSMVAELENFISESKVCDWKRCISKYSKLRARVFYMLALNAFRLLRVDETLLYTKLFLVTSESGIDARILHCAWTMLSFFGVSALFTLTEDDLIMKLSSAIFPFRMSLHFDKDSQDVLFNFGSALYQIRSKLVRFGRKLDTDDIRVRWIRIRTAGMLEESRELFLRCASLLSAGDPDLWRCHYFLAKIDDKIGNSIESVMEHHYESARQLEASGVQYPMRINTKKQDHIEAVELHYRTYAYLIKWLIETDGIQWTREQLTKMLAFAETFCGYGVCRRNTTQNEFAIDPSIREHIHKLVYSTHISAMNEVDKCLYDAVERIHLTNSILTLCEEGFEVCIKRFPHFKSYYRLAQLSFYRGDYAMASSLIFTRLFARKKSCNPDNIFETLIAITQTDLDRGDSLQYHVYRIASLAITIASRTNDCVSLISLLHTFCTLIFCGNTDYLLAEDVEKVYRYTCSQLLKCVNEKVQNGEDSSSLAVHLYDLYQYAERNNEKKLCTCLRKCFAMIAPHLDGFVSGNDPVEIIYQLYLQSKQRPTKRRLKSTISSSLSPSSTSLCLSSAPVAAPTPLKISRFDASSSPSLSNSADYSSPSIQKHQAFSLSSSQSTN